MGVRERARERESARERERERARERHVSYMVGRALKRRADERQTRGGVTELSVHFHSSVAFPSR